eukprot:CAMPEP_0117518012 /NCGR_PEP_ID=MMETSP0784-20121206/31909_1 /TAXON_ID=39447 /ORGANISM="" /LENGTH=266 /DNA_ID=CAMNT_0005313913 /DNA_START=197 /DNA_END=994 /DNA_ORIENTATION=-
MTQIRSSVCVMTIYVVDTMWPTKAIAETSCDKPIEASLIEVEPTKLKSTAYLLWLTVGIFGGHHFYLDRPLHGLVATWTCNFMGAGLIVDAFMMPAYVRGFNGTRTIPGAPEGIRPKWVFAAMALLAIVWTTLAYIVVHGPVMLQRYNVVDIARLGGTVPNAYRVLGLPNGGTAQELKAAYRKESLRWHPDRNVDCGKTCEDKMAKITEAYRIVQRHRFPKHRHKDWPTYLRNVAHASWMIRSRNAMLVWIRDRRDHDARTTAAAG